MRTTKEVNASLGVVCYGVSRDNIIIRISDVDAVEVVCYGVSRDGVIKRNLEEDALCKVLDVSVLDCYIINIR